MEERGIAGGEWGLREEGERAGRRRDVACFGDERRGVSGDVIDD